MDFSDSQYAQLIVSALAGIAYFILLFRLPERASVGFILLMIPFQLIDSKYGTINTVLVYIAAFAFLLQGRMTRLPFLLPILLVLFSFLLAFSQSHPAARVQHILYFFGFFSNILLFYIVYNFVLRTRDWQFVFNVLLALNVLVLIYCAIQFIAGPTRVTLFGIQELSMNPIRKDGRLVGPFKATAATAEYLTIQCVLLGRILIQGAAHHVRRGVVLIMTLNVLFLIATGNRGGFITIIFGALLFLGVFRRELGLARVAKIFVGGAIIFTLLAVVLVNFTEYGMLFGRLEGTSIEGGVPDTRATVWPIAWEGIQEAPILGHGPKLFISTSDNLVADIPYMLHAHNLALHILFTTGIVGFASWMVFFWLMSSRLLTANRIRNSHETLSSLPRIGLVILCAFAISQLRIEFLREGLLDYQNYLFVLFALLLSACSLLATSSKESPVEIDAVRSRWEPTQRPDDTQSRTSDPSNSPVLTEGHP